MNENQRKQINAISLLDGMPDEAKDKIAEIFCEVSEEIDLEDGEVVMQEGHLAFESGYILLTGTVEVEKEGKHQTDLTAPVLLGEMAQFKACDVRSATVRAKGSAVAMFFHWDEFYELARQRLTETERLLLTSAMDKIIWERFGAQSLLELPLFHGLSEVLRFKACVIFPWITDRVNYKDGETLFDEKDRCQSTGYLLMKGAIRLNKRPAMEKTYNAPNIIGIMPKQDPALVWSATAIAQGDTEVLTFSWKNYATKLQERLTQDEQRLLIDAMKQNAAEHFWH
jgi:CRP-like cAMP-binding protein